MNRKQYFLNSIIAMAIAGLIVGTILNIDNKSNIVTNKTSNNYNSTFSYENNESDTKMETSSEVEKTEVTVTNSNIVKNDATTEDNSKVYYSESNNQTSDKKENNVSNNHEENTNTSSNNNQNVSKDKANDNVIEQEPIKPNESNRVIRVVDKSISKSCAQAIEYYYEDSHYKYYFTCIKSSSVFVFVNNQEYTIKYALNNGIVTIDELINVGFKPLKESKNLSVK